MQVYQAKVVCFQSGSVSSSDEFSDEDLNEACGSQEVARMLSHDPHEDLKIIGSKPRLHPMFEVPMIKPSPVSLLTWAHLFKAS